MKLKVFLGLSLISSFSFAATFNGYIIKTKKNANLINLVALQNLGEITKVSKTSFGNYALLKPKVGLIESRLSSLANNPDVEFIEPNYIVTASNKSLKAEATTPSDKNYKKQWGLNNDGRNGSIFTTGLAGEDINAVKAWGVTKGSKKIKIAIIDSGVDYTHPDLKDQIDINQAELNGKPGVDDDGNGFVDDIYGYNFAYKNGDPMDGYGHGTQCAGILGASHNSIGIAGMIAEVSIIPVKFLDNNGAGEIIDVISAIDYALKRGANVLSNSWGTDGKSAALEDAIRASRDAGVTFVAAAGNSSSDNDKVVAYPGGFDFENIISVGAYSSKGTLSYFSNFGATTVDVMAPGEDILTIYREGQYFPESGTSMAAPFISGVVGLILSKEPNLKPAEIKERLIRTSTKTTNLSGVSVSGGRVDTYRALINQ